MANNRIAYGLCKKYGIKLKEGATPADAWKALRDEGHGDEADAMSANSENDDKSVNDIANEGKEKKPSISMTKARGEYNDGKGSRFADNPKKLAEKMTTDDDKHSVGANAVKQFIKSHGGNHKKLKQNAVYVDSLTDEIDIALEEAGLKTADEELTDEDYSKIISSGTGEDFNYGKMKWGKGRFELDDEDDYEPEPVRYEDEPVVDLNDIVPNDMNAAYQQRFRMGYADEDVEKELGKPSLGSDDTAEQVANKFDNTFKPETTTSPERFRGSDVDLYKDVFNLNDDEAKALTEMQNPSYNGPKELSEYMNAKGKNEPQKENNSNDIKHSDLDKFSLYDLEKGQKLSKNSLELPKQLDDIQQKSGKSAFKIRSTYFDGSYEDFDSPYLKEKLKEKGWSISGPYYNDKSVSGFNEVYTIKKLADSPDNKFNNEQLNDVSDDNLDTMIKKIRDNNVHTPGAARTIINNIPGATNISDGTLKYIIDRAWDKGGNPKPVEKKKEWHFDKPDEIVQKHYEDTKKKYPGLIKTVNVDGVEYETFNDYGQTQKFARNTQTGEIKRIRNGGPQFSSQKQYETKIRNAFGTK